MWSLKTGTTFETQLIILLTGFSLLNAGLIYWRETWDGYDVQLHEIALWQAAIWMLWYPLFRIMAVTASNMDRSSTTRNKIMIMLLSLGLPVCHFVLYFLISHHFSPLNPLPNTGYGVYPYFFIFYFMIDLIIVWGLWGRLGAFKLMEEKPSPELDEVITVKKGYNNVLVPIEQINWVAAENYYVRLYTPDDNHLLREPLKVLFDRLPENQFVQIHRSTLVRRSFITSYSQTEAVLNDGVTRRISKTGMKNLQATL